MGGGGGARFLGSMRGGLKVRWGGVMNVGRIELPAGELVVNWTGSSDASSISLLRKKKNNNNNNSMHDSV